MQPAISGLRSRSQSKAVLATFLRLTDSARTKSCVVIDQSGGFATPELTETTRFGLVPRISVSAVRQEYSSRRYGSSAEFSGGSFNVSSSASESEHQQRDPADDAVNDRVLLLEASLNFVVSYPISAGAICKVVAELLHPDCSHTFRVIKGGQMQPWFLGQGILGCRQL